MHDAHWHRGPDDQAIGPDGQVVGNAPGRADEGLDRPAFDIDPKDRAAHHAAADELAVCIEVHAVGAMERRVRDQLLDPVLLGLCDRPMDAKANGQNREKAVPETCNILQHSPRSG